jgi:hypothetical protein
MDNDRRSWWFLALGVIAAALVHGKIIADALSIPAPTPRPAGAFLLPLAIRAAILLVCGALVALLARGNKAQAAKAFCGGIALAALGLALLPPVSNLWPIALVMILVVTVLPAAIGSWVALVLAGHARPRD